MPTMNFYTNIRLEHTQETDAAGEPVIRAEVAANLYPNEKVFNYVWSELRKGRVKEISIIAATRPVTSIFRNPTDERFFSQNGTPFYFGVQLGIIPDAVADVLHGLDDSFNE